MNPELKLLRMNLQVAINWINIIEKCEGNDTPYFVAVKHEAVEKLNKSMEDIADHLIKSADENGNVDYSKFPF